MTFKGLPPFTPADIVRIQHGLLLQRQRRASRPTRRPMRIPLILASRAKAKAKRKEPQP